MPTPLVLTIVFLASQTLVYFVIWGLWQMSTRMSLGKGLSAKALDLPRHPLLAEMPGILLDTRLSILPGLDRLLKRFSLAHHLKRWLVQAGLSMKVDLFLLIVFCAVVVSAVIAATVLTMVWSRTALIAVGAALPFFWVGFLRSRRRQAFQEQLPYALDGLGRAMQAGHSFTVALRMVSRDLDDPIAAEFRLAAEEINFGASVRIGMERLADRINTQDIRFFVAAVLIHMQTGGKLTELLFSLAALVRDRRKLAKTIRVLSAEGRLAAWILTALPVVTGFVIYTLNPSFMSILWTDPNGIFLLKVMAVMVVIGLLWMAWLTRAEVA
jgi:tight adherence protein B